MKIHGVGGPVLPPDLSPLGYAPPAADAASLAGSVPESAGAGAAQAASPTGTTAPAGAVTSAAEAGTADRTEVTGGVSSASGASAASAGAEPSSLSATRALAREIALRLERGQLSGPEALRLLVEHTVSAQAGRASPPVQEAVRAALHELLASDPLLAGQARRLGEAGE